MRGVEEALAGLRASEAEISWNPDALEAVGDAVARALALARFEVFGERDGPFHRVDFGPTPQQPRPPMFPAFVSARTTVGAPVASLMESLEALQQALVWEADCAEFTDARNNSIQYLRAAGHLELAAGRLLDYAKRVGTRDPNRRR